MTRPTRLVLAVDCLVAPALSAFGQDIYSDFEDCTSDGWLEKRDEVFAADCAAMAFEGSLEDRQFLAWMFFVRVNQQIDALNSEGMSASGKVPLWMAWPTDPDTFHTARPFEFDSETSRAAVPRDEMKPSDEKKDIEAGRIATAEPDGANEEVTRNRISYDYLIQNGLTTKLDVAAFFARKDDEGRDLEVNMPVGSVELKASWLQVTEDSKAPEGALTFTFEGDKVYWWRGLHIMVKMQSLPESNTAYYSEEPSWFWTTFEFNDNPGAAHVRQSLISQRAPLADEQIYAILEAGSLLEYGYDAYAPNGTQIRFTENGDGETPVILGHTDMEDFAGGPNTAQPQYWTQFQASCHSCHATAAYNPATKAFFPFSVPTGALHRGYNKTDGEQKVRYLGQGYRSLDFMWPIAFQAR